MSIATTTSTTAATMSTSARTIMTRRTSVPRVSLSTRQHIDMHERGLVGPAGAREIIAAIKTRKSVTKLILGHNELGGEGCRELFRFLCTDEGRRYQIAEISLNANVVDDVGLEAIAEYLDGNLYLRELFLNNNAFQGEIEVAVKLSAAINTSKLELISLTSNKRLSDKFFIPFISHLDSPTLRELQLSAVGLTRLSAPALTAYCISPRSRALESLRCNGNSLGTRAVRALLTALRGSNFTLQRLEVYANAEFIDSDLGTDEDRETETETEESVEEARARWTTCEQDMKNMLIRNEVLRRKVHEEALALLLYARTLLLNSSRRSSSSTSSSHSRPSSSSRTPPISSLGLPDLKDPRLVGSTSDYGNLLQSTSDSETNKESLSSSKPTLFSISASPAPSLSAFPFRALPIELQHYILAFLSPSLSVAQRVRIFSFASDPTTLRPLLPSLRPTSPHAGCIPDPASLPFSSSSPGTNSTPSSPDLSGMGVGVGMGMGTGPLSPNSTLPQSTTRPTTTATGMGTSLSPISDIGTGKRRIMMDMLTPITSMSRCAGGKCMGAGGSVLCHRAEVRMRWLAEVGCVRFDVDGRGEKDVLMLIAGTRAGES
ncbi:RNI-like protein [Fomitiporia mediterranea MF3/22]|uniref:RNI-like protein n=1 Tax=Fomitiporia mediterranea (strain MF3/22) TaxID=694068 RepID=R7SHA5_FOMME|nr:RNI-like protein [Fomitiporia mediterranea MF3/22]EJC97672.1 RNI-like protein [Fomitiporia mediterranea MF3/22]